MHTDLERLIRLQHLDDGTTRARQMIVDMPAQIAALETRLAEKEQEVAGARHRLEESLKARRELEKQLAAVQTRLSRYKDQLMEVKTNKEYQAMQHEIATADREVRAAEDRILDRMEEGETLTRDIKGIEAALAAERAAVNDEKARIERERVELEAQMARAAAEREELVVGISSEAMATFDGVARKRNGIAVVEARNGHCTVCNVRLRPQQFLEVRRNDTLIQCESCQRILFFVAPPTGDEPASADA
jgi:predicted  nucleic acid-binding Zn-ribbon protein